MKRWILMYQKAGVVEHEARKLCRHPLTFKRSKQTYKRSFHLELQQVKMSKAGLRSDSLLFSVGDIDFFKQDELDFTKVIQLPTHRFVIERYYTIKKEKTSSVEDVTNRVSTELEDIWTFCNVYTLSRISRKKKVHSYINKFECLKKTSKGRQESQSFKNKLEILTKELHNGFDIRCTDEDRIKSLRKVMNLKMEQPEEDLWKDNCDPDEKTGLCERKWFCGGDDEKWLKAAMKRYKRSLKNKQRVEAGGVEGEVVLSSSDSEGTDLNDDRDDRAGLPLHHTTPKGPAIQTRSSSSILDKPSPPPSDTVSGKLKCRDGFKSMNPDLMVVLGLLVSKFGVSENKVSECMQLMANTLFNQSFKLPTTEIAEMEDSDETEEPTAKKRKLFGDLTYTLPTSRTIHKWINK